MPTLLLLFVAAFVAFALSTLSGGGAGLMLIPVLGLVVPAAQVPAALSIGTATSALSRVVVFRRAIRWRAVAWFVPAALPSAALGAWALTFMQPLWLQLALGLFLVGNLAGLMREPAAAPAAGISRGAWLAAGVAGGFLSGFTGAIGLVLNRFYLRSGLEPHEIVATRAANEVLLHLVKLGVYTGFGLVTRDAFGAGALVAVAAATAPFAAERALAWLDARTFNRLGTVATCLAGAAMLVSASGSLAARHGVVVGGRVGLSGLAAELHWRGGAASLNWRRGHPPEFERTVSLASLPSDVRAVVTRVGQGAERIVCEHVLRIGGGRYEITFFRGGDRIQLEV